MNMIIAWFLSKRVRQVIEIWRHVEKLVHHQRDLMTDGGISEVQGAVAQSLRQQAYVAVLRQYLRVLAGQAEIEGVDLDAAETALVQ